MKNSKQNKIICQMIDELDLAIGLNSEIGSRDLIQIKQNLNLLIEKLGNTNHLTVNSNILEVDLKNESEDERSYSHPFQSFYPVLN